MSQWPLFMARPSDKRKLKSNQMPKELTPEEISTKENYDKHAEGWARWWERDKGSNIVSKETSKFKELLPKGRILEIGSGLGQAAGWFVANGYDYLGTDISSGMLEQARKNNPGIRFDEISVYDLNFDEPFDGFWCSAVLLHIPKNRLNEALSAIHKNIKEGCLRLYLHERWRLRSHGKRRTFPCILVG